MLVRWSLLIASSVLLAAACAPPKGDSKGTTSSPDAVASADAGDDLDLKGKVKKPTPTPKPKPGKPVKPGTPVVPVTPPAALATLCVVNGVPLQADPRGVSPAEVVLQNCINATPSGGTLSLPPGTFSINGMVQITRPINLNTAGTAGLGSCYDGIALRAGVACATLRAANTYVQPASGRGFIYIHDTTSVHLSHLILDGNIEGRSSLNNVIGPCAGNAQCPNIIFDVCNAGSYYDPLTQRQIAMGDGQPDQACSIDNSGMINAIGMGSIVLKRSLSFIFASNNVMYNGRFLKAVAGDSAGGSDGFTSEDHIDGVQIVNNQFIDNSDGGISINGGVRYGYIANNQILQYNESVGNGMVLARLPYDVLDTANLTGTIVENNYFDGCTTNNCLAADRYGCDHAQNSYMQTGIFIGSDGWANPTTVQGPIGGFWVRNNVIAHVSRGIQIAGAGRADLVSGLSGNTIRQPRWLGDGTFHDCHMSPYHIAKLGAGIAWCQNAVAGSCNTVRAQPQDFATINGLLDQNILQDGAGLNASLDYFTGF